MRKLLLLFVLIFSISSANLVKHSNEIKANGKPIMFIFTSSGCPYCERLKKDLEEVEFLNKIAKEFDIYEIARDNPESYTIFGEPTTTQTLQMIFKIKVTPYVVIFNSKGEKLWQIPGYSDPFLLSKILKFTKGVDEGKYKKSEWKKYLLEQNLIKDPSKPISPH